MNIILVEDYPAVARISCDVLRDLFGHEVRHAASAADALALVSEKTPDLMLIDLNLPDMNGYDLARRLRDDPRLAAARLVALTGFGNPFDLARAKSSGIDACYRKPMDFALLPEIVRRSG